MTLRTVLLSLQALLAAAEPDDPQDAVVAKQYKENFPIFFQTARHWTNVYAGGQYVICNKQQITGLNTMYLILLNVHTVHFLSKKSTFRC